MTLTQWLTTLLHRNPHAITKETLLERNDTPYGWVVQCRCGWRHQSEYLLDGHREWRRHAGAPKEAVK